MTQAETACPDAWGSHFLEYRGRLLALARRNLNPVLARRVSAEDVVQEALLAACGKMAFFGPQSLRASFPGVDDVFPGAGKKGQFRKLAGCAAVYRGSASFAYVFIQAGDHDVLVVRRDQLRLVGRHLAGFPVPVPLLMGWNFPD